MIAGSIFSILIDWLALATGSDAKAAAAPVLDFPMPPTPPETMQLSDMRPAMRYCCAMGQPLPHRAAPLALDAAVLWANPHRFRRHEETGILERVNDNGGTIGYVYTRHGGFIDLGHTRDFIDHTRYFAQMYLNVAGNPVHRGSMSLFNENADIFLEAELLSPKPDLAISALIGAKLAFEYSVWHEINTYFTSEKYSSHAPEDLFSNALGVVIGFRALMKPKMEFDAAAHLVLKEVLEQLGMQSKAITEAAIEYVKDRWWALVVGERFPVARRRNFLTSGPIKPWLVTDLVIPGKETQAADLERALGRPQAASIPIPALHNGVFLERRGRLAFKNPMQNIQDLVPLTEFRSIDLVGISRLLRDHARAEEGASIDTP